MTEWADSKFGRLFYKNKRLGKCVICGKPSKPYLNCSDCRFRKKLRRTMRLLELDGAVKCFWKGFGFEKSYIKTNVEPKRVAYKSDPEDSRRLPRIKNRPINIKEIINALKKETFTEEEINDKIFELKTPNPTNHKSRGWE